MSREIGASGGSACATICLMGGRQCHLSKQWIAPGEEPDCWTTTEAALTQDLSEDLRDAWERLRETAAGFGYTGAPRFPSSPMPRN